MNYIKRNLFQEIIKWDERREIIILTGPRQAGKTTLMRMYQDWILSKGIPKERICYVSFDDREALDGFIRNPTEFIRAVLPKTEIEGQRIYLFVDEAQYSADIGRIVKQLYDTQKNLKIILSGSSSLDLISSTSKYLVGRSFKFELMPFGFDEFVGYMAPNIYPIYSEKKKLVENMIFSGSNQPLPNKEDIWLGELSKLFQIYSIFGGYPEVVKSIEGEERMIVLKNLFNTYLEKDIISLLHLTDTVKFRKIVSILAASTGGIITHDSLAVNSGSYFAEIKRFIDVLEQTYILNSVRPFHKNLISELRKNPKCYFLDSGMRNYVLGDYTAMGQRSDSGQLAENFVFGQINRLGLKVNFWRTTAKAEVDFVLTGEKSVIPIEVKYTAFDGPKIPSGLRSFIDNYSPPIAIVATKEYWGETELGKTKIKFVPLVYL